VAPAPGAELTVEDPATGRVVATVPVTPPEAVASLVATARAAQPAWVALGFEGRARVLRRAARWVLDHADEVVATLVAETGKAHEDALLAEVTYAASAFRFWARRAEGWLADERVRSANPLVAGRRLVVRHVPVGVVGVIGPWNYPLINGFGDCIPALAAGNAVVLKPSEATPLTSLLVRDGLRACGLPEGVYAVAVGGPATGEALVDAADMVMLTGSTETGRRVAQRAARRLIPVSLELGGKDPMVVLADADLERAANAAVYSAMQNGGQSCTSVERVYVEAPVHDRFVELVVERVRRLRQGAPDGPGSVEVGAVTWAPQLEVVAGHVEAARAAGARVLTGGRVLPGPGRFYAPTVLVDVPVDSVALREETFGPTLPIVAVPDAEEAVRLANASEYGLSASVWTRDVRRGEALARRIEAGAVLVNDTQVNYFVLELPMGGWKASGVGVRHGRDGIRKYTRPQALLVTRRALRREPHWFPYRARSTRALARGLRLLYRGRDAG
jgi:acyl-CoA reductase-like NAD-dependent aldehyde dehydrogenase